MLVLPETQTMTLGLLRKIKELSDKGAVIIGGGASPQKSPSLSEMGAGDVEVKKLAGELWPKIVVGKTAATVLGERGIAPDFRARVMLLTLNTTVRIASGASTTVIQTPKP